MFENKLKNNKGITLIALVVTIVVLLILAGVSISLVIGENGLIKKSKEGVGVYKEKAEEERQWLESLNDEFDEIIVEVAPLKAIDDWEYTLDGNIIYLTKYIGKDPNVIVYGIYEIDNVQYNTNLSVAEYSPFKDSKNSIETIKIKTGVTSTQCNYLFSSCKKLTNIDIGGLDTSKVTSMEGMFNSCTNLCEIKGLDKIDTSNVTTMYKMFGSCSELLSANLSNFNTSNVTDMMWMFLYCYKLKNVYIGKGWDTSNVTNMYEMFYEDYDLEYIDTANWNTSKVKRMACMFDGCKSLKTLDLSNWNNDVVTDMYAMFRGCSNLIDINLTNFYTSKVTDMKDMFKNCTSLSYLNLSSFSTSDTSDMRYMFAKCNQLEDIYVGENWNTSKAENTKCYGSEVSMGTTGMFDECGTSEVTLKSN